MREHRLGSTIHEAEIQHLKSYQSDLAQHNVAAYIAVDEPRAVRFVQ
jgi:hypothetical protein